MNDDPEKTDLWKRLTTIMSAMLMAAVAMPAAAPAEVPLNQASKEGTDRYYDAPRN